MTWLLAIAGLVLSLFLPGSSADRYYQGLAHGAAILGGIWLGLHLMTKLKLKFIDLLIAAAGLFAAYSYHESRSSSSPTPSPVRRPFIPWRQDSPSDSAHRPLLTANFSAGGPIAPDGVTEVECDLPRVYRQANTGGRDGAGLCVFTSIMHSARYQQDAKLWNFQRDMKQEPGGGHPHKVDAMIKKYAPGTMYVQHTGGDVQFLELALRTGRFPSVTYSGRDGVYYKQPIAHMVNLAYLDNQWAAILDNNFIDGYLWMARDEFLSRWKSMGGGWAVVLLAPPPPQPPIN